MRAQAKVLLLVTEQINSEPNEEDLLSVSTGSPYAH